MSEVESANACLKNVFDNIVKYDLSRIGGSAKADLDVVLANAENGKAVLAVVITSLVKKVINPAQDIRKHQAGMQGGYSGRGLDTKSITPFLKSKDFPAMASGSGWLTRSLEQSAPYTLDYQGKITPKELKQAFLNILDKVQSGGLNPDLALAYLLDGLVKQRSTTSTLRMARPTSLTIEQIVHLLDKHFSARYSSAGASRLPVLAIYSAYQQMIKEVGRYKTWTLGPLASHTSADTKSGAVGDIQVLDNKDVVEAVEVKHGIVITKGMITDAFKKFRKQPVQRYYILSTADANGHAVEITDEITRIQRECGCQVIVNGVEPTLKYYLRLLEDTDKFINNYANLLEREPAIKYEHKEAWNKIVSSSV